MIVYALISKPYFPNCLFHTIFPGHQNKQIETLTIISLLKKTFVLQTDFFALVSVKGKDPENNRPRKHPPCSESVELLRMFCKNKAPPWLLNLQGGAITRANKQD